MSLISRLNHFRMATFKFNPKRDFYQVLNLSRDASRDQIKKGFTVLAKKFHPDVVQGNEDKFKQINEAYQVLSNPQLRLQYDSLRGRPIPKYPTTPPPQEQNSYNHSRRYPERRSQQFGRQSYRQEAAKQHEQMARQYNSQRQHFSDLGRGYSDYEHFAKQTLQKKATSYQQKQKVTQQSVKRQEQLKRQASEWKQKDQMQRRQRELRDMLNQKYAQAVTNTKSMWQGIRKIGRYFRDSLGKK